MQRKDLVCSLEIAKTLKRLGVPQDSYFYYMVYNTTGDVSLLDGHKFDPHDCEYFAAFTSGELGELLKNEIGTLLEWQGQRNRWYINDFEFIEKIEWFENEVEARGKLLIKIKS